MGLTVYIFQNPGTFDTKKHYQPPGFIMFRPLSYDSGTGFRSVFRQTPEGLGRKDNTKTVVVVLVVRVVVVAIG